MTEAARSRRTEGRRDRVLRVLRDAKEPLGIAEIAARVGIHANTVRFHLDRLVERGQVERSRGARRGPGRPPLVFAAVRAMDPAGPRHFQVLAEVLAATLEADPEPRRTCQEAGQRWGRGHAALTDQAETGRTQIAEPVERLMTFLDDLDFAPERPAANRSQIGLRRCPFLELAMDRPDVVCPIHLGLMQGALEAWGSSVTIDRLDAFVEPDRCVAHLATA